MCEKVRTHARDLEGLFADWKDLEDFGVTHC